MFIKTQRGIIYGESISLQTPKKNSKYVSIDETFEISWVPAGTRGSAVWRLRAGTGA